MLLSLSSYDLFMQIARLLYWTVLRLFQQEMVGAQQYSIFFLLHLSRTNVWTSVFWTTFGFLRNCLHLYDVSYSSQSERVCGKLYEERSYWTVPARALCFQCGTRFQICSHHPHHPHNPHHHHHHPHNSADHRAGQRMHERVSRDDGRVE